MQRQAAAHRIERMAASGTELPGVEGPGFGEEHPALAPFLSRYEPDAQTDDEWGGLRLRISAYVTGPVELPPVVTCAARAIVLCGTEVLVCETPRDVHVLPGGQIEAGETAGQAAAREVFEEAGWRVAPEHLEMLGFLHFHHVTPAPVGHPFPNPDFVHAVFVARVDGSCAPSDGGWVDVQGWEQRSALRSLDEALGLPLASIQLPFLRSISEQV